MVGLALKAHSSVLRTIERPLESPYNQAAIRCQKPSGTYSNAAVMVM